VLCFHDCIGGFAPYCCTVGMNAHTLRLEVSIGPQTLRLWQGFRIVRQWSCSTSKFGMGSKSGSFKTPLGLFEVREKHGDGAAPCTIFKSRQPKGVWQPGQQTTDDLVLTRILWLHGLEPRNANTYERYIYIHGTNDEASVGRPASHGCVRLKNADMIELFDLTPVGTPVWIGE
jgi:L,D-transpeptidase YbiS